MQNLEFDKIMIRIKWGLGKRSQGSPPPLGHRDSTHSTTPGAMRSREWFIAAGASRLPKHTHQRRSPTPRWLEKADPWDKCQNAWYVWKCTCVSQSQTWEVWRWLQHPPLPLHAVNVTNDKLYTNCLVGSTNWIRPMFLLMISPKIWTFLGQTWVYIVSDTHGFQDTKKIVQITWVMGLRHSAETFICTNRNQAGRLCQKQKRKLV